MSVTSSSAAAMYAVDICRPAVISLLEEIDAAGDVVGSASDDPVDLTMRSSDETRITFSMIADRGTVCLSFGCGIRGSAAT